MKLEIQKEPVEEFSKIAARYCSWVESSPQKPDQEVSSAVLLISELYCKAIKLPEVEPEENLEDFNATEEDRKTIYNRLRSLPVQYYSTIFDPLTIPAQEAVMGDLADDLSDIYWDLKEGLFFYQTSHLSEAVWHWKFNFENHWSKHALEALKVLHHYIRKC